VPNRLDQDGVVSATVRVKTVELKATLALLAVSVGLLAWAIDHLNVLHAHLHPPAGTIALWASREGDTAQHLTWAYGMRDALVIPDYHMPAVTKPALFSPLFALLGQLTKLGIDASAAYAAGQLVFAISAIYCILVCLRIFLSSRGEAAMAVLLLLAAAPLMSTLNTWRALHGEQGAPLIFVGDGLFMAGALTRLLGTASVYAALILVTRYVVSERRHYLYLAGLVTAVSGLCHPFEVFTIMAATALTFLVLRWPGLRSALMESLVVVVPGVLSLLPYLYFSFTVPWMRQITSQNIYKVPDLVHLLGILGIPTAFVLVNLVIGPRLRATKDVILQCWFAAALLVMHVPRMPWSLHTADGLCFIAALLAVRQAAEIPYLRNWVRLRPRFVALAVTAIVVPAIFVHVGIRYMLFREGVKLESPFGMSAVSSRAEHDLIGWFRRNGNVRDLVIVPTVESSSMVATAPVHVMASHWLFSGTYGKQVELRDAFYRGDWTDNEARDFLRRYGIDYVVVPDGSPVHRLLSGYAEVATFPPWTLYHLPDNRMPDDLPER
jgi:hypothetical protein